MGNPASCRVSCLVPVVVGGIVVLSARTYGSELTSVINLRVLKATLFRWPRVSYLAQAAEVAASATAAPAPSPAVLERRQRGDAQYYKEGDAG